MDMENENFYDEIASFLPQSGDYSLEDLDEIIRSTDSDLDASLNINTISNNFDQNDFDIKINDCNNFEQAIAFQQSQQFSLEHEKPHNFGNNFSFYSSAFPSPTSSQSSAGYLTPSKSLARESSPTSLYEDHFNPDEFLNFLNDDDVKIDDLATNTILKANDNCRNTPSPTGSCTSSIGSSTSGVQSDASSVASMPQNFKTESNDELLEFIKFKNEKLDREFESNGKYLQKYEQLYDNESVAVKEDEAVLKSSPTATTLSPITIPLVPVTTIPTIRPANSAHGTIIPLKTVPLTTVNRIVNIKSPTAVKIENKTSPKPAVSQSLNLVTAPSNNANDAKPKLTTPTNTKPKTIYLSSNDFKALMQKMNTNGKKNAGPNGQIPKIIMKTAIGKVITANKLANSTSNNTSISTGSSATSNNNSLIRAASQPFKFVSKIVKSSGPMVVKQQPSKIVTSNTRSAAVMSASRATLGFTKLSRNDFGFLKGLNDEKLLKKQLRMLKNRESASLSRKKKKEYIEKLENRIRDLEKENYSIKGENSSLRSQLMAFAKTCNCKHGNVSEFILNTLNMNGKSNGSVLNSIDASCLAKNAKQHLDNCNNANKNNLRPTATQHVKIAPKPPNAGPFINKGFKQRMNAATVKKNIAVLFAMAFMVTLNVGNFQNYLNKSSLENAIETSVTTVNDEAVVQTGRRLLWVPNEHEVHVNANRTKRDTEMASVPPPPLHFLRPINRTTADKMNGKSAKDEPPIKTTASSTAAYANSTLENMRLARNLHKWIGGHDYLNLSGTGIHNNFEQMKHYQFGSKSYMNYDLTLQAPIGAKQKRKIIFDSETQEKHAKLDIEDDHNSLDIFKPRISEDYLRLFKGIKRQDDTFYVLSFKMDHILLPASANNKSSRPKISLMLPAGDPLHNGDIVLMQVDCEVINTTELEIKSHMIPEKLKPLKFSTNVRVNPNNIANNETAGPASATATKLKDSSIKKEELKVKPSAPRTYFMMGPKNQISSQAANLTGNERNIVKSKPAIVKLNANDSVIGSGVLNVRNSSLFSRMRDTVGSQANGLLASTNVRK